jgi:hypothetical protein
MATKRKSTVDKARELMAFWPLLLIIVGFVGTWYSIQNKVEAMEPVKEQVKQLDTKVDSIEKSQSEIQKQLELRAIKDQAAREKINSKLDRLLLSIQGKPQVIIEKEVKEEE